MLTCKKCRSADVVKSGKVRGKQRYLCKACGYHFVEGNDREKNAALAKNLCVLFSAMECGQYRRIAQYLGRDASLMHRWMQGARERFGGFSSRRHPDEIKDARELSALQRYLTNAGPILAVANTVDGLSVTLLLTAQSKELFRDLGDIPAAKTAVVRVLEILGCKEYTSLREHLGERNTPPMPIPEQEPLTFHSALPLCRYLTEQLSKGPILTANASGIMVFLQRIS